MELASKDSCTDCGNCRLEQISKLNNISAVGKKCCGCTACVNVCPQKVIYMVENSEGFYYPKIVDKGCIECGLCIKSCPALNSGEFKNKTLVGYAATSQDITTSENSSSGGIFALIAREFLRNNSWVIGAKMESDYCLKHVANIGVQGVQTR